MKSDFDNPFISGQRSLDDPNCQCFYRGYDETAEWVVLGIVHQQNPLYVALLE